MATFLDIDDVVAETIDVVDLGGDNIGGNSRKLVNRRFTSILIRLFMNCDVATLTINVSDKMSSTLEFDSTNFKRKSSLRFKTKV